MDIGYMRCSTDKQELDAQRARLEKVCDRVFEDEAVSGTRKSRPGLDQALAALRPGDSLVAVKLDRLSRSLKDLMDLSASLQAMGVNLKILDQGIDTSTAAGRMFFHMVGAFAEFERELIVERTKAGMAIARSKGHLKGGVPKLNAKQSAHLRELHEAGGHNITELAELFGVTRPTVYRTLDRAGAR